MRILRYFARHLCGSMAPEETINKNIHAFHVLLQDKIDEFYTPENPSTMDITIGTMSSASFVTAARVIRAGGVVAYPTEAVFGLGCDPLNEIAVRRVLELKNRPDDKGVILIAAHFSQLEPFIEPLDADIYKRLSDSWPGPITWLVPARPWVSTLLRGRHATLAVRVTAHPSAAKLCRTCGSAIVSTSANPTGQPPCRTVTQLAEMFSDRVDLILDAPLGSATTPTEIRDPFSGRIIRSV